MFHLISFSEETPNQSLHEKKIYYGGKTECEPAFGSTKHVYPFKIVIGVSAQEKGGTI